VPERRANRAAVNSYYLLRGHLSLLFQRHDVLTLEGRQSSSTRVGFRISPSKTDISAVAALDEPNRRRLYDYLVRQPEPVSRDQAAAALELPRTTAAFHLDRLVDGNLLDVTYQRRTGRTDPSAGQSAKLYRQSDQHVAVTLPERRYDLPGQLLSSAAFWTASPPQD
jgi:DNA-binding transcriptional ArsR family regulator